MTRGPVISAPQRPSRRRPFISKANLAAVRRLTVVRSDLPPVSRGSVALSAGLCLSLAAVCASLTAGAAVRYEDREAVVVLLPRPVLPIDVSPRERKSESEKPAPAAEAPALFEPVERPPVAADAPLPPPPARDLVAENAFVAVPAWSPPPSDATPFARPMPELAEPDGPSAVPAVAVRPDPAPASNYWNSVRSEIVSRLVYPATARRRNIEGRVDLHLTLDEEGRLLEARTANSTSDLFSRAALAAAQRAAPFPAPDAATGSPRLQPEGQDPAVPLTAIVPIEFRLIRQ